MSLGSWDPNIDAADASLLTQPDLLPRLVGYAREDRLEQLGTLLDDEEQQRLAGLMKIEHGAWRDAVEPLPDDDVLQLVRFFAVAENLPGWEAGAESPVIPLAQVLRKRGARLDRELLRWLREVNDNRFLPYGPL